MKKKILIFSIVVLIVLISTVFAGYLYVNNKVNKINYVDIDESSIESNDNVEQELEKTGYRTIALLGIDSRADDYGKGNRSDCIILAVLNQKTKEVNLVSVYRDTYLKITGRNLDKVTHAYSYGGA